MSKRDEIDALMIAGLKKAGGCVACGYWSYKCIFPKNRVSTFQIYDDGCEYHTKLELESDND